MLLEYSSTEPTSVFLDPPPASNSSFVAVNPLIERLERFVTLGIDERQALDELARTRRFFQAHDTLVHEGSTPNRVCLILRGVAFRYRYLANGRRQIFGYLLPGDLCDTQFVIHNNSDHNVAVLSDSEVAIISLPALMNVMVRFPRIERALLMMSMVDAATMREWLLNVGQRDATQKLAHFFCEMNARFHSSDFSAIENDFAIPITQTELADTMGLTVVHVNRILQRFRREGLLSWSRRHVCILDRPALIRIAGFDSAYLRLETVRTEPRLCAYG